MSSSNPSGGPGAWSVAAPEPGPGPSGPGAQFDGVSCATTSLFAATPTVSSNCEYYHGAILSCDQTMQIATATDPAAGSGAWKTVTVGNGDLNGISCPSALCVAVEVSGDVITSTNPTGDGTAWTTTKVDSVGLDAVSCPSYQLCVAVGGIEAGGSNVITSVDPTGGAAAWEGTNVASSIPLGPLRASGLALSGLGIMKPRLAFTLTVPAWGAPIKSFSVTVPPGLSFTRNRRQLSKGITVVPSGGRSLNLSHGALTLTPAVPAGGLSVTVGTPAINEQTSFMTVVNDVLRNNRNKAHRKKSLSLRIVVRVTSADQSVTRLVEVARIR